VGRVGMARAPRFDGSGIVSWEVRIVEKPAEADAARLVAFVAASPAGHLYQYPLIDRTEAGARVRPIVGWAERGGVIGASAVVRLRRTGGFGPWSARIDRGPVVLDLTAVTPLLETLGARLLKEGAASIRVNPLRRREDDGGLGETLGALGFTPVPDDDYDVTLEVDIAHDREALLASFPKGTRYTIRQAIKAGVVADREVGDAEVRALEEIYATMVERKGATPRPPGFFHAIARFLAANPSLGFIQVARYEDQIVASIVVTRYGHRALYTFGASRDADDGIPKSHLLQFEAMVAARSLGCTAYDLGGFSAGIGEEGSRSAAQSINFFKSRFTKNAIAFMPCRERVLRPVLYRLVEGARRLAGVPPAGASKASP
jgi:GNAT acetyltransferase-like protein